MYTSQFGQDKYLNENIFKNKRNGTFLDIGAHDGKSLNNTYFFEKELNWTGICIEPHPIIFEDLKLTRNCHKVNKCVSNESGYVEFTQITGYAQMLSGITSNYNPQHMDRIQQEVSSMGGEINKINIKADPLHKICEECGINNFDFCSLDVEGSEFAILSGIDFSKININYFCIENNYRTSDVKNYLEKYNYTLIGSIQIDDIYMKRTI